MRIPFTQLVKPFGDNPSERFAASCLRKILLNRTVPRTVRPFQGSHERCRLQHTLQETYASPERARGTAKRWRGAPPAPTFPPSPACPHKKHIFRAFFRVQKHIFRSDFQKYIPIYQSIQEDTTFEGGVFLNT